MLLHSLVGLLIYKFVSYCYQAEARDNRYFLIVRSAIVRTDTCTENLLILPTKSSSTCVASASGFRLEQPSWRFFSSLKIISAKRWYFGWYFHRVRFKRKNACSAQNLKLFRKQRPDSIACLRSASVSQVSERYNPLRNSFELRMVRYTSTKYGFSSSGHVGRSIAYFSSSHRLSTVVSAPLNQDLNREPPNATCWTGVISLRTNKVLQNVCMCAYAHATRFPCRVLSGG